jgi:glutathione S-transferase
MKLYDTQRSGNAWKVRLFASLRGIPLERATLSIDRGDLRTAEFRALAPMRHVPILETDDGRHVSESMAILYLLAQGSDWWPAELHEQVRTLTWLSFEQDRHMKPLAKLRLHRGLRSHPTPADDEVQRWTREATEALDCMESQLAASPAPRPWIAQTAHPTIADIALYPYTRMAPMGGIDLEGYPAIGDWLVRIEALPGYQWLFPATPNSNYFSNEIVQDTP